MRYLLTIAGFLTCALSGCDLKPKGSAEPASDPKVKPPAVEQVKAGDAAEPKSKWFDITPTMWLRAGHFAVHIVSAEVRTVDIADLGSATESAKKHLLIKLSIQNRHANRKGEYYTWADTHFDRGRPAHLSDEFDNTYKRMWFGFGARIIGQVERNRSIFPGETITEVLVFEAPVASARSLFLELPGENLGQDEVSFCFRIPWAGRVFPRPIDMAQKPKKAEEPKKEQPEVEVIRTPTTSAVLLVFYLRDLVAGQWSAREAARRAAEQAEAERIARMNRDEVEAQLLLEKVTARIHFLELIEKYPNTRAAQKARDWLAKVDKAEKKK